MKKLLSLTFTLFIVSVSCESQNLNYQWTKSFGGVGNDVARCITTDNLGNVYLAGGYADTFDIDPGPGTAIVQSAYHPGIFFQKYDPNGNLLWVKTIYGRIQDVNSICVDSQNNLYATGGWYGPNQALGDTNYLDFDPGPDTLYLLDGTGYDLYVLKLDPNGNLAWAHSIYGPEIYPGEIAADEDDNIIVSGELRGTIDFDFGPDTFELTGTGLRNFFILKVDSDANFIWAKHLNHMGYGESYSMCTDPWNSIYFSAYTAVAPDLDPGPAEFYLPSNHGFLVKLDENGDFQWAQNVGEGHGYTSELMSDPYGNIYAAGYFNQYGTIDWNGGPGTHNRFSSGGNTVFLLKMDTAGTFQWFYDTFSGTHTLEAAHYSEANNTVVLGIHFEDFIYGYFPSPYPHYPVGENDISLLEIDPANGNGNHEYVRYIGGTSEEYVESITSDASGNIYTCGYFKDTTEVDPSPVVEELISNGLKEAYFQKYEACSPSYGSEIVNACESYTWIDGITYTSSNSSATHIIQNASGCDSIVSLDLTIENLTELATSTVGATITAENNLATYQWLDCNNGFTVISGETGQSYTPGANGNYAVELDQNGCIDTTACVSILTVGLENHWINQLQIHPNPSSGIFNMELTEAAVITVLDARGRTVVETNGKGRFTLDLSGFSTGTYTLQLRTDSGVGTKRLVRQ